MAVPYQPQNLVAQQTDGNILLTWSGALEATSYSVQRGLDGVNFTEIATTTAGQYLDAYPGIGIKFYYQIVAVNGDGNSTPSSSAFAIAAPTGELSLYEFRLRARERADRVNSPFVTDAELNFFIRLSMYELYDLQIGVYERYSAGAVPSVLINTNGTTQLYDLPNGVNYLGGTYQGVSGDPAKAFYKVLGVDLGVNTSNNAWVTLKSFNFSDRNNYVYPNSTSTIYGVYNMRYNIMGNQMMLIPVPAGNQQVRLWYAPRLPGMLADTDLTTIGWDGFLAYAIVRAAKYILDKEESDSSKLDSELLFLKQRIESMSSNKDSSPETINNTRRDPVYGGSGFGNDGPGGGGW